MKKYLFIGPDIVAGVRERYVVDIKCAIDWVDGPEEASADYEDAAKVTQGKLTELGIETHLEEMPHRRHPGSDLERFWLGHANKTVTDDYSMLKEDVTFRKEVAEKVGIGFELPIQGTVVAHDAPKEVDQTSVESVT